MLGHAYYYGLPYEAVLALDDVEKKQFGAATSPGFARLCEELARAEHGSAWSVARNGTIIEQADILTTHNLAVLFDACDLAGVLGPKLPLLARRCFEWICRQQQLRIPVWRAALHMMKNTAYAWRQLLFFLSVTEQSEITSFLEWSESYLREQPEEFRLRFMPIVRGLAAIAGGERFDADGLHLPSGGRRFLGWSVGRHWLLAGRT